MSTQRYSKVVVVMWMCAVALSPAAPTLAETLTFQQGTNGYDRAQDTAIRWAYTTNFADTAEVDDPHPGDSGAYEMLSTNGGRSSVLEVGNFYQRTLGTVSSDLFSPEAGPTYRYSRMFIRFRDVFGTAPGQVAADAEIASATLRLYNTEDLGAVGAAGGAALPDPVCCDAITGESLANPQAQPKLNAGTIAVYPLLTALRYGNDDGTAAKGVVTGRQKRRGKEDWSQPCLSRFGPNDPIAMGFNCGPADVGDPDATPGAEEYDSIHPGAVEIFKDAIEGFKEFDVSGLVDFITGDGVFVTALSPPGELPTLDINYGQAYRSSEFGDTAEDIATRPMLVIELGGTPVPGDANGDGVVDVADLGVVGANFGSTNATLENGDFTGDGNVDVADLGVVGANWTAAQAAGSAAALVPEPTTLSLLAMSVLMVGRRRR